MSNITNLSIRRPVATAMFYLVVITVGVVGLVYLPVDLLPPIEFPRLTVFTRYANVGPEEVEEIITDPIENALSGIPNLERISSRSQEGMSWVGLDFSKGTNIDEAANDVRGALERLRDDIPVEAEQPAIWKFDPNRISIVTVSVASSRSLDELTRILEREVTQRLEQIPGVGTITIRGGIYRQVNVDLKRDRLQAAGLTPLEVRSALSRENTTLPGGNIKEGITDQYVRTLGEFETVEDVGATVIRTVDGAPVRIRDVAEVHDGFEDIDRLAELRGMPVIRLWVQKQSGANTVTVARAVRDEVHRINLDRKDVQLTVISDQSSFIQNSIDNVRTSAVWGGLLAILVLYFFLRNGSSTMVIATAIPISVIATFGVLYFGGLTLNQMTFGGLALGIGLMVDNSIVVLEKIVRLREEKGEPLVEAARDGTRQVVGAIVASTLTTCVIFLPLAFAQTTSGALFQALAIVVVFALACSLLVALTIVPVLASKFLTVRPASEADPSRTSRRRFRERFARLEERYVGLLKSALARKSVVFGTTAVAVAAAVLLWGQVPVELAPQTDADEIDVDMEMAQGTNIAVVKQYLDELERAVRPLLPEDDVDSYATEVRGSDAEIEIRMVSADERSISSHELADRIRREVDGMIPGASIRVRAQSGLWVLRRIFSSNDDADDVQIELRGYNLEVADEIAREIVRRVEILPGVADARMSRREGRPEQNILFDREKIAQAGLSVQEVAQSIQTSIGGSRAGVLRVDGEQFPIIVRLRPEDRLNVQDLDNISVETSSGMVIPVSSLVSFDRRRGPTSIRRVDGRRVTYVTATLESGEALGDAVQRIRAATTGIDLPDGFAISFGGEWEEQQKAARDFTIAIVLAFLLIYMVMAGQFERFLDPLIVIFAVPIALVGVVPTLLLTGTTFNVQSAMGLVMLIGIVVNNAIVLVDYINLLRRERDMGIREAVLEAGRLRLRPILMTTTTTVIGLLPLAIGLGAGTEIQAPLARVVIGGLIASTLITLVLIPSVYVGAYSLRERLTNAMTLRSEPQPVPGS